MADAASLSLLNPNPRGRPNTPPPELETDAPQVPISPALSYRSEDEDDDDTSYADAPLGESVIGADGVPVPRKRKQVKSACGMFPIKCVYSMCMLLNKNASKRLHSQLPKSMQKVRRATTMPQMCEV